MVLVEIVVLVVTQEKLHSFVELVFCLEMMLLVLDHQPRLYYLFVIELEQRGLSLLRVVEKMGTVSAVDSDLRSLIHCYVWMGNGYWNWQHQLLRISSWAWETDVLATSLALHLLGRVS